MKKGKVMKYKAIPQKATRGMVMSAMSSLVETGTSEKPSFDGVERAINSAISFAPWAQTCHWHEDQDGNWFGSCGAAWHFNEGGPKQNNVTFCPTCAGHVQPIYYDPNHPPRKH